MSARVPPLVGGLAGDTVRCASTPHVLMLRPLHRCVAWRVPGQLGLRPLRRGATAAVQTPRTRCLTPLRCAPLLISVGRAPHRCQRVGCDSFGPGTPTGAQRRYRPSRSRMRRRLRRRRMPNATRTPSTALPCSASGWRCSSCKPAPSGALQQQPRPQPSSSCNSCSCSRF